MVQLLAMGAAGREALRLMPEEVRHKCSQLHSTSPQVQAATREAAVGGPGRETLDKYAAKHFYARWNKYKADNSDVFT